MPNRTRLRNACAFWELPRYNSKGADPLQLAACPAVPAETLKNSKKLEAFFHAKDNTPVSECLFPHTGPVRPLSPWLPLEGGCPAASGLTLAKTFANVVKVDETNPVLGFLQPGNILCRWCATPLSISMPATWTRFPGRPSLCAIPFGNPGRIRWRSL